MLWATIETMHSSIFSICFKQLIWSSHFECFEHFERKPFEGKHFERNIEPHNKELLLFSSYKNARYIESLFLVIVKGFAAHYRSMKVVHFYLSQWKCFRPSGISKSSTQKHHTKKQWIRFIFKDYRCSCRTLQKPTSYEDIKMKFMTYSISIRLSRVWSPYVTPVSNSFFCSRQIDSLFSIRQKRLLSLNLCFFRLERFQCNFLLVEMVLTWTRNAHGTHCRYVVERPSSFFSPHFRFF